MMKTFDQIKDEVFALTNSDAEVDRLVEELNLFEERGWNQYIAFAINYLREMNDKVKFFFPSLSVMDSLFVNKAINPEGNYEKLLSKKHSKDILFNDALRLGIDVVYADPQELAYLGRLSMLIAKEFITRFRLPSKAKGIMSKKSEDVTSNVLCAISTSNIPEDDFNIVYSEKKDGPREEINTLRKYLIFHFKTKVGI